MYIYSDRFTRYEILKSGFWAQVGRSEFRHVVFLHSSNYCQPLNKKKNKNSYLKITICYLFVKLTCFFKIITAEVV